MEDSRTRRKNVFIKKRFQTGFAIKFLLVIVAEAVMAIALFAYLSRGTVITGYTGSEIVVEPTGAYFMPALLLANLLIICVTAAGGFLVLVILSHRIAGPLYRFEKTLDEIAGGDLTYRFNLRSKDELGLIAEKLNEFASLMDGSLGRIQGEIEGLERLLAAMQTSDAAGLANGERLKAGIAEARGRLAELKKAAGYFRTSGRKGG
jgi:methyl-accepting chemotaxis protein